MKRFDRRITSFPYYVEDDTRVYSVVGKQRFINWFLRLAGTKETTIYVPANSPDFDKLISRFFDTGRFSLEHEEGKHAFFVYENDKTYTGICSCGHQNLHLGAKFKKSINGLQDCWRDMLAHVRESKRGNE